MESYGIYKQADDLVRQCGTRNVEHIIRELGIWVYYEDSFKDLLGMYTFRWNHRLIFLNPRIEGALKQMVMAHELGHDQRHRNLAKAGQPLKEFNLFMMKDATEYEANAFASHILLPNDDVYSLAKEGHDVFTISQIMGADVNLMLIKMQEMNKLGYDFNISMQHDSRFFRRMKAYSSKITEP